MNNKEQDASRIACKVAAWRDVGLKGTASSISVLKLLKDEYEEEKECLERIKNKTSQDN